MRRLLLVLAALASVLALTALPAAASPSASCVAGYRHSFDGAAGTLTITGSPCAGQSQPVTLVSYTAGDAQFVYDSATGTLTPARRSLTLKVAVPRCSAQVGAFFGAAAPTETTSAALPDGTAVLGLKSGAGARSTGPLAWHTGGAAACAPAPTVTYAMGCDGTFIATLANGADANVTAVFLTGNRRIRLSPGRSTTVKVAKSRTLTVRDSSFTTHVAVWRAPTTCTAAPPVAPPTPQAPVARPTATSPSPSASASASTSSSPAVTYANDTAAYPQIPDHTTGATALAKTGLGTGSIVAILIGLLMIGAGVAAITWLIRMNRGLA
ncbi:hypothetical protein ACFQS1_05400 [Paractinoplanes rhizophilus]|uniref:Uncharacterized protein n=1 Tax=Paractinoplanes rhizophilus TaxID=1416877 RepID=A0ABW2HKJ5_9ACTN